MAAGRGLALGFALGVNGLGGVFNMRRKTSSRLGESGIDDLSDEEMQAFYTAIGAIIVNWGVAESCIAQACHILIQAGGHKSQRIPPTGMKRRLDLIKSCFKDYPELRHMRDFTRGLISNKGASCGTGYNRAWGGNVI